MLNKTLNDMTLVDIENLIGVAEHQRLEFKKWPQGIDYPKAPWVTGGIGDIPKKDLAEEVCAMANSYGGDIILGIKGGGEKEKSTAEKLVFLPAIDKLKQIFEGSFRNLIEPPLSAIDMRTIVADADGAGILVIRIGRSHRRPHGVRDGKRYSVYVKSGEGKRPIDMREIQDLVIERRSFEERRRSAFLDVHDASSILDGAGVDSKGVLGEGFAVRLIAVPADPLAIPDINRNRAYQIEPGKVVVTSRDSVSETLRDPFSIGSSGWLPAYRARKWLGKWQHGGTRTDFCRTFFSDGRFEQTACYPDWSENCLEVEYVSAGIISALASIDQFRMSAGEPDLEYGVMVYLLLQPGMRLGDYYSQKFRLFQNWTWQPEPPEATFTETVLELGEYAVRERASFSDVFHLIEEDICNAAAVEWRPRFEVDADQCVANLMVREP